MRQILSVQEVEAAIVTLLTRYNQLLTRYNQLLTRYNELLARENRLLTQSRVITISHALGNVQLAIELLFLIFVFFATRL